MAPKEHLERPPVAVAGCGHEREVGAVVGWDAAERTEARWRTLLWTQRYVQRPFRSKELLQ